MARGIEAFIQGLQAGQMASKPISDSMIRNRERENELADQQTAVRNKLLLDAALNPDLGSSMLNGMGQSTPDGQQSVRALPLTADQEAQADAGKPVQDSPVLSVGGLALDPAKYKAAQIANDQREFGQRLQLAKELEGIKQGYGLQMQGNEFNFKNAQQDKEIAAQKDMLQQKYDQSVKLGDQENAAKYKLEMDAIDRKNAAAGGGIMPGAVGGTEKLAPDENGRFPQVLSNASPQLQSIVKQLVDYSLPAPKGFALKNPLMVNAMALAEQYDPNFKASDYEPRQKAKISYTSGKDKQNLDAINTAIGHLGTLKDKVDALDNFSGIATPLNYVINPIERTFGDTRQGDLETARHVALPEVVKAATGKPGTLADNEKMESTVGTNASKASQLKNLTTATELLASRIRQQVQDYESTMGRKFSVNMLSPASIQGMRKLGINPEDVGIELPSSQTTGSASNSESSAKTPIQIKSIKRVD